jgi:hypothetical protein
LTHTIRHTQNTHSYTIRPTHFDGHKETQTYLINAIIQIQLHANFWTRNIKHTQHYTHTHNKAHTIRHTNLAYKFRHTHLDTQTCTATFRNKSETRLDKHDLRNKMRTTKLHTHIFRKSIRPTQFDTQYYTPKLVTHNYTHI